MKRTFNFHTVTSLAAVLAVLASFACHNVKPDEFAGAVVDCSKVNPEASAARAAVETCLTGAVSQNYVACLSGLVTEAKFAVDEVACVVAWVAQKNNSKVAASAASPADLRERDAAAGWLVQERITIRNSYSPRDPN